MTKLSQIFASPNFQILKHILIIFAGWRIILIIFTFYGVSLLPTQDRNINGYYQPTSVNYWDHWAYWDSAHILRIVESGYIPNSTPFFPLYPLLIKGMEYFGLSSFWGGFIIAQAATIIALYFFYKLILLDYQDKFARKALLYLLIFPTSFYLGSVYSEPLFLALSISAFYFCRKRKWLAAAVLAGLSATTRLIGVAVILGIFAEYFFINVPQFQFKYLYDTALKRFVYYFIGVKFIIDAIIKFKIFGNESILGILSTINYYLDYLVWYFAAGVLIWYLVRFIDFSKILSRNFLYLLVSAIPPAFYLIYLYFTFGDPLVFLKGHEAWGRHFTLPLYAVTDQARIILHSPLVTGMRDQLQLELATFVFLSILFVWGLFKLRFSYILYFALSVLMPISSGKLMSLPRIALVIFPIFILLAQIKNEYAKYFWMFISITFLAILTMLYFNNFWVA